ncbi:MAG: MMPL family transporter [Sphaerobacter sp.]|nr:MMPL family transporter [Sphaerobacter sp.]
MFLRWGYFVARHRIAVILVSLLLLAVMVPLIPSGLDRLSAEGWEDLNSESASVAERLARDFGQGGAVVWIVFSSDTLTATDPAFQAEVQQAIAPLASRPEITSILSYATTGSDAFISRDGHKTYVLLTSSVPQGQAGDDLTAYRALVHAPTLDVAFGGWDAAYQSFTTLAQADLRRQEIISLPITLVVLVLVFGSLVAAGLPLLVGLLSIPAALGGIAVMAHLTDTSVYVLNIATILGLAVSIDYSLFLVSRFREELARREVVDAVAVALATAGKAVFFSGLIVTIGLIGMVFFPMFALRSLGIGGALVVALAVYYALTFLPALLVLIGPRIDRLRVRRLSAAAREGSGFWGRLATMVMRRPVAFLLPVLAGLILVGLPFLSVNFGTPGMDMLPRDDESRVAYDQLTQEFAGTDVAPIEVLLYPHAGQMTDPANLAALGEAVAALARMPGVARVESIFDLVPGGTNASPEELAAVLQSTDPAVAGRARGFLTPAGARLRVDPAADPGSPEAKRLVRQLRSAGVAEERGLTMLVGGATAVNIDMVDGIIARIPYVLAFIVIATYVVLCLLLGSFFLPLKAILMAALSITASFGALVWIFQEGHLSGLLRFEPTGYIVPMVPVVMFCILFGLSMDYEVLMLTRMHEEYQQHGDNTRAVGVGLERTGRVITSAALIMITVFGAGIVDRLVLLKSLGVGMALAVFIDATIVRALLVPATMRIMGWVNWWAPHWLRRLQQRLGVTEAVPRALEEVPR